MKIHKQRKGFTLIELLIVIALLGTLAVALLAAIDPFEQFKKGTDTARRNTAQEYYNALIRFYAQRSGWPDNFAITPNGTGIVLTSTLQSITGVIGAGELKDNFIDIASDQLSYIYVARAGTSKLMVCFQPESKSFQKADKNTRYGSFSYADSSTGAVNTDTSTCSAGSGTCYWCVY